MQPCVLLMLGVVTLTDAAAQDQPKSDQQSEHMAPAMNMVEITAVRLKVEQNQLVAGIE